MRPRIRQEWGEVVDDLLESRHSWTLEEVHGLVSGGRPGEAATACRLQAPSLRV